MAAYNIFFNPVLDQELAIKKQLKRFSRNYSTTSYHPLPNGAFMEYNVRNNAFNTKYIKVYKNESDYIDTSNLGSREDNIRSRLDITANDLPDSYRNRNNMVFKELTGPCKIRTRVNSTNPCMLTLSNYFSGYNNEDIFCQYYFDTVLSSDYKRKNPVNNVVLHYSERKHKDIPFVHSGDNKSGNNALLQYISVKDPRPNNMTGTQLSGVIYFHAFMKKTFLEIQKCEPSICLVDDNPDDEKITMYIYHFNLALAGIEDSRKAAVVRFKYNPREGYIDWIIPTKPIYFNVEDDVNIESNYNTNCIESSVERPRDERVARFQIDDDPMDERVARFQIDDDPMDNCKLTEKDSIVIAQKCIFNMSKDSRGMIHYTDGADLVLKYFRDPRVKYSATFHQDINIIDNVNEIINDDSCVDARLSLPIGGFSPVSGILPILQLGKTPENGLWCRKVLKALRAKYEKAPTVIVFVSENYLSSNIPTVHYKLNAIYVVVCQEDNNNHNNLESILNNVNTSMAMALQGPVSVTLAYYRGKFYFLRGVWNLKFGDEVLDELHGKFSINVPLYVQTIRDDLDICPIYSPIDGKVVCHWPEDHSSILRKIYSFAASLTDVEIIKSGLKFILSQIESLIQPDKLLEMKDKCLDLAEEECPPRATKGEIWNILASSDVLNTYVLGHPLDNNVTAEVYTRAWLIEYIYGILGTNPFNVTDAEKKIFNNAHKIIQRAMNKYHIYGYIFEILETIVPVKGSYGQRARSVTKALRSKKIAQNVETVRNLDGEAIGKFFDAKCSREGIIVFALDINTLINKIQNNNNIYDDSSVFLESALYSGQIIGNMQPGYLESFFPGNDLSFNYGEEIVFSVPILDEFISVMSSIKSIKTYNWRQAVADGPADIARILFRKTVNRLLNQMGCETSPGSGIVGRACLIILASLISKLADLCTPNSESDSASVIRLRAVQGLYLSIMASGDNSSLLSTYQLLTYDYPNVGRRDFINERYWIKNMLYSAEKMKIPSLDVKQKVVDTALEYMRDIKIDGPLITPKDKKQKQKNNSYQKAKWYYEFILPIVKHVFSYEFKEIDIDELANNEPNAPIQENVRCSKDELDMEYAKCATVTDRIAKGMSVNNPPKKMKMLKEFEKERKVVPDRDDKQINKIETKMNDRFGFLLKNKKCARTVDLKYLREIRTLTYPGIDHCKKLKELYEAAYNANKEFAERSSLCEYVKLFLSDNNPNTKKSTWIHVASIAFDYYSKKSKVLLSEWTDFFTYWYNKTITNLDDFRKLRCAIFETALRFRNPFFTNNCTFTLTPVLESLMRCEETSDYHNTISNFSYYISTNQEYFGKETADKITSGEIAIRPTNKPQWMDHPDAQTLISFLRENCGKSLDQIESKI